MTPRTAAVVGAGAIGGWLADALAAAGWRVSMVARGETLAALRRNGLRVDSSAGSRHSTPVCGAAAELGTQQVVWLAVKAQALPDLAAELAPLIGPDTCVVSATNGIPWWFFDDFGGLLANRALDSVDPGGIQSRLFGSHRALGAVVHASVRLRAPAQVEVIAADRLLIGEPRGELSARARELVDALRDGGLNAIASERIRLEVWAKLWGNMNMNPLSALTRCGCATLLDDPQVHELCLRMMEEMRACGTALGLELDMSAEQRIAVTRRLGNFQTSMLADARAGRALELAPQLGAVVEIAARLGLDAPYCRAILGLARLLSAGLSEEAAQRRGAMG